MNLFIISKYARFLLHLGFWLCVWFIFSQFKVSFSIMLMSFIVLMIPTYLANTLLVNLFYKKKQYISFVLGLIMLNFLYTFVVYWIPSTIYKKDNDDFFTIFIDILFFTSFTSSIKIARYSYLREKEYAKIQIQQLETELSLLKSQVNPHFLFNTLNNLYGLILQENTGQAAEITLKLSDLMRYVLESSKIEKVSLKKEIQFIQDYLALEKIRLSAQVDIRLEVSGIENEVFIAPLLFIPLVENTFKHGLQTLSKSSFAYFSLAVQGKEVFFEAQNSVSKSLSNYPKSGTGLENLRKRLELIYPQKHFLEVEEKEDIFKVILQLNL